MRRLTPPILSLCILSLAGAAYANQPSADRQARAAEHMATVDTDGSGTISLAEYTAQGQARYTKTDTNGDGFLSQDERKAAHEAKQAERKANREARAESRPEREDGQDGKKKGPRDGQRPDKMDANSDGFISQAELSANMIARFESADTDANGVLDLEELKAAQKKRRKGGKKGPRPDKSAH